MIKRLLKLMQGVFDFTDTPNYYQLVGTVVNREDATSTLGLSTSSLTIVVYDYKSRNPSLFKEYSQWIGLFDQQSGYHYNESVSQITLPSVDIGNIVSDNMQEISIPEINTHVKVRFQVMTTNSPRQVRVAFHSLIIP